MWRGGFSTKSVFILREEYHAEPHIVVAVDRGFGAAKSYTTVVSTVVPTTATKHTPPCRAPLYKRGI